MRYLTVPVTSPFRAALKLRTLLKQGSCVALALDGPYGPAGVIKPGALFLAKKTGKPIIIARIVSSESFRIKTRWDHYEIPFPFARATVTLSDPLFINESNFAQANLKIKNFIGVN